MTLSRKRRRREGGREGGVFGGEVNTGAPPQEPER